MKQLILYIRINWEKIDIPTYTWRERKRGREREREGEGERIEGKLVDSEREQLIISLVSVGKIML